MGNSVLVFFRMMPRQMSHLEKGHVMMDGCGAGLGLGLDHDNVVTLIKPGTPAASPRIVVTCVA